ncbi:Putative LOC101234561 [Caligus rogercresseyi]|uniref:LOC101234561 n=1 Tax=Caligus rogercresseyi TaxID=217165 RepID=A0A7T8GWH7_CALRO|nr:Putative LOC101234561 [Caligus rogercresseyi]
MKVYLLFDPVHNFKISTTVSNGWRCSSAINAQKRRDLQAKFCPPQGDSLKGVSLYGQTGPQIDPQSTELYKP